MAPSKTEQKVKQIEEKSRKLEMAKIVDSFIPKDQGQWETLADRSKGDSNLYKLDQGMIQSGSNTTDAQFVTYRTVFEERMNGDQFEDVMEEFGITTEIWEAANKIVSNSDEFKKFVSVMEENIPMEDLEERDGLWPGSWVSVKSFQEKITFPLGKNTRKDNEAALKASKDLISSFSGGMDISAHEHRVPSGRGAVYEVSEWPWIPARSKSDYPDVEDESIANTYAIFLLEQSSRLLKCFLSEWTMDRIKLEAWFNAKRYSAYTDGGLRPRGNGLIQASVEVKRGIRASDIQPITKQETSQVVAMIKKGCPAIYNGHWLVASLDRHEAYLNFSSCEGNYVRYIRNGHTPSKKAFLTTKPSGPWDIGNVLHMERLVRILVALTLKADLVVAQAICNGEQPLEETEGPRRKRQRRS